MPQINIRLTLYVLHAIQILVALNGGYHSYLAITHLTKYKPLSNKAAKFSKLAAKRQWRTRKAEAAGVLALLFSLGSAVFLLQNTQPNWQHLALNLANLGVDLAARIQIASWWRQKTPMQFVDGYEEGLDRSESVQRRLSLLEIAWVATALATALGTRPGAV